MGYDFLTTKKVKARKKYRCELYEYLSACDLISHGPVSGQWSHIFSNCANIGMSDEEIQHIKEYCESGFKIEPGEICNYTSGKSHGEMVSWHTKIVISEICHKYELFGEE